jgi:hypothetical protein
MKMAATMSAEKLDIIVIRRGQYLKAEVLHLMVNTSHHKASCFQSIIFFRGLFS